MYKEKLKEIQSWVLGKIKSIQETKADKEGYETRDEIHYSRLGWIVLAFGFGGFLLWAMFAPLDKGVAAAGTVITDGQRKVIQPTVNGVIDEILVKDGDQVKAGQLLVRMNDLYANAQVEGTRASIEGLKGQIAGLEASIQSQQSQLKYLQEQVRSLRELSKEGFVARNRVLDYEREAARLTGSLSESQGNLERARNQLKEQQNKLPSFEFDLANTTIESPVDGAVVNLQVFTKGQVVQAGLKLMEISPVNTGLVIEAKVPVNLIDKVYTGLPVEMIFSALNQRTTPRIPGTVTVVSADKTSDDRTGESYYKIQARVSDKGIKLLGDNNIRPGMPADVYIITGERTMMNYMLRPILDRMRTSLGEE